MALTNFQYDSIIREYEQRRLNSHRILEERKEEIYRKLPAYRALDDEIASVSVAHCKRKLMGEDLSDESLEETIDSLTTQKKLILTQAGYSINYLEPQYICPYCKDTGFVDNNEKCHCFKQAMLDLLYEQSNIRNILQNETFDSINYDFRTGEDRSRLQNAVNLSMDFIKNFDLDYQNLFFYGTVGTGKTMLSNCIANEIIKSGHSCIYFSAVALFEHLSEYVFKKSGKENIQNPFDDIYECDLLIIDDLGTELSNSFVATQLFACLNERHLRHKSTIISSNLMLEELRDTYSDRIFSRIVSNYTVCRLSGSDVRIQIKRNENRK